MTNINPELYLLIIVENSRGIRESNMKLRYVAAFQIDFRIGVLETAYARVVRQLYRYFESSYG